MLVYRRNPRSPKPPNQQAYRGTAYRYLSLEHRPELTYRPHLYALGLALFPS